MSNVVMPWRSILCIASIFALRVFGFMVVLPIIMHHGQDYVGASAGLLGLAIGVYGLMQACFNLALGAWSDIIGRKNILYLGLLLIIVGSIVAANSSSVYGLIIGRGLQGCGAIGSTLMALLTDIVPGEKRGQAMACVGASIGASFWFAIILSPVLLIWLGLDNIFNLTALLASLAILLTRFCLPDGKVAKLQQVVWWKNSLHVIKANKFYGCNFGVATIHAIFTMIMAVLAELLLKQDLVQLGNLSYWYAGYLVLSLSVSVPLIIKADRDQCANKIIKVSWLGLGVVCVSLAFMQQNLWLLSGLLVLFFAGFTVLESLLMVTVGKLAVASQRGAVMGVYSTCQFFGIFLGGFLVGMVGEKFVIEGVFLLSFALILLNGIFLLKSKVSS